MMKFEKGKLYTVVGVEDVHISADGCYAGIDQDIDVNGFDRDYAECVADNNFSVEDCNALIAVGVNGDGTLFTQEVLGLVDCVADDFYDEDEADDYGYEDEPVEDAE